jgi:hypothetical protein
MDHDRDLLYKLGVLLFVPFFLVSTGSSCVVYIRKPDLIIFLVNALHRNLDAPVTAKFRVFPTVEKTIEYARMPGVVVCDG